MAVYTTSAILQGLKDPRLLAQLANDDKTVDTRDFTAAAAALLTAPVLANINACIAQASAEIDSILIGHVDLTDSAIQTALQPYCNSMALYWLHTRKGTVTPDVETTYTQAKIDLRLIARGDRHLVATPQAPTVLILDNGTDEERVFDSDTLENF